MNIMPIDSGFLAEKFRLALPYDRYVQTGTDEQQRRWKQVYDVAAAAITPAHRETLRGFVAR